MGSEHAVSQERRRQMIAREAYFRAERRGFSNGDPVADWLAAEAEVDARLRETGAKRALAHVDERLEVVNSNLQAFTKKSAAMTADVREEFARDLEKLAALRDKFQKRLDEVREHGEQATEKAKAQADKLWREIADLIERVSSHKGEDAGNGQRRRPRARKTGSQTTESRTPRS